MNKPITYALANALLTVLYIIAVALFMYNGEKIFGHADTAFIPIVMLLLFVLSATITGSLMFGRPILWYLDGKKKEALILLGHTIGIFSAVTIIMLILVLVIL